MKQKSRYLHTKSACSVSRKKRIKHFTWWRRTSVIHFLFRWQFKQEVKPPSTTVAFNNEIKWRCGANLCCGWCIKIKESSGNGSASWIIFREYGRSGASGYICISRCIGARRIRRDWTSVLSGETNEYVNSSAKVGMVKSPFSLLLHQCCISFSALRLAAIQSILSHLSTAWTDKL